MSAAGQASSCAWRVKPGTQEGFAGSIPPRRCCRWRNSGSFVGLCAYALDMTDCSLQDADFSHLVCGELQISHCDLQRARFDHSDIMESHFADSNCASAKFQNAKMNLSRLTG